MGLRLSCPGPRRSRPKTALSKADETLVELARAYPDAPYAELFGRLVEARRDVFCASMACARAHRWEGVPHEVRLQQTAAMRKASPRGGWLPSEVALYPMKSNESSGAL
jgi:hypothetical protein